MSADLRASASVVTLSPKESSVAAMPSLLTRSQTARTSSTDMPATKRLDILRPIEERSEKERKDLFCERAIKNDRSKRSSPSHAGVAPGLLFHEGVIAWGSEVEPLVETRWWRSGAKSISLAETDFHRLN